MNFCTNNDITLCNNDEIRQVEQLRIDTSQLGGGGTDHIDWLHPVQCYNKHIRAKAP